MITDIMQAKVMFALLIIAGLSSCGTAYKEKTAPCKRPANLTSFAPDPRHDCGSMKPVNEDPVAAINTITN